MNLIEGHKLRVCPRSAKGLLLLLQLRSLPSASASKERLLCACAMGNKTRMRTGTAAEHTDANMFHPGRGLVLEAPAPMGKGERDRLHASLWYKDVLVIGKRSRRIEHVCSLQAADWQQRIAESKRGQKDSRHEEERILWDKLGTMTLWFQAKDQHHHARISASRIKAQLGGSVACSFPLRFESTLFLGQFN